MFRQSVFSILLLAISRVVLANDDVVEFYLSSKVFGYSETAPIAQIVIDDFEGPDFDGGNHSFTHNVWEAGAIVNGFKLAGIARYDYALNYTRDLAYLVYADKNEVPIEKNRPYELNLSVFHARTAGLKMGYQFDIHEDMHWGVDVSYLEVSTFLDGDIDGAITVLDDDYQGDIHLDYVYDSDKLLDRQADKPEGQGFAVDLAWDWQVNRKLSFAAKWVDLYSAIKIERAPFTTATASSNRVSLDPLGRIDVKPVLSGRENYREHTLNFPRQMRLEGRYWVQESRQLGLRFYRYDRINFVSASILQMLKEEWSVDGEYNFSAQAVTLGVTHSTFRLALSSDRLDLERARTFGLISEFRLAF